MANEPTSSATTTADVVAARRRSSLYGLNPASSTIPYGGEPTPSAEFLTELSAPVLDRLLSQIEGSSLGVVISDRAGRLIYRDAPITQTLAAMDSHSLDVGFSLAEPHVGTNGVGTSLETRRPTLVVGSEHFLECFQDFTCANAPIVHPTSGRVEGSIGVLCPVGDTSQLLLPTAVQLASQIGALLLERSTANERFLMEQFLLLRRNPKNSMATIGPDVCIATAAAQGQLADVDHRELWGQVAAALRGRQSAKVEVVRSAQAPLILRCTSLTRGGRIEGAAVEIVPERSLVDRARPHRTQEHLGHLVGTSRQWQAVVSEALIAAQLDEPVLIVGEPGTGRRSLAKALAARSPRSRIEVLDSADLLAEGPKTWLRRIRAVESPETTVILHRIDELPTALAAALAKAVQGSSLTRFIGTCQADTSEDPGQARLLHQLGVVRIEAPPLRDRREDIAILAQHFAGRLGRPRLSTQVVKTLSHQSWPGNTAELGQAIRSAHVKARTAPMTVQHLPRHLRQQPGRAPLHGLRQKEAETIMAAINSTTTKAEAAKRLGLSRATLYRRIDAYGLDVNL